ncbi:unnamed protein product, partial [Laminaria digitata]
GDQTNKVVYGAMEHGQPLRENEKVSQLLRDIGQRLMIAEREVEAVPIKKPPTPYPTPTPTPSSTTTSTTTASTAATTTAAAAAPAATVTGAVEMKGIVGSDGRSYLLDVSRLTPRDANWVRGEKGTGVYDSSMAVSDRVRMTLATTERAVAGSVRAWEGGAEADRSFEQMAVLRPELLTMFTRHKVAEWFRAREAELLPKAKQTDAEGKSGGGGVEGGNAPSTSPPTPSPPATIRIMKDEDTIPSPSVSLTVEDEQEGVRSDTKAVVEGGEAGEGGGEGDGEVVVLDGEGEGMGGDGVGAAARPGLRLSEEEVGRLKEEQEARCKELAMNVNVFMPYKVIT